MHTNMIKKYYFISKLDSNNIKKQDRETVIIYRNYSTNAPSELEILIADLNQDGNINIQDIILMIQTVLND